MRKAINIAIKILWLIITVGVLALIVWFNIISYKTAKMDCRQVKHISKTYYPDSDKNPSTGRTEPNNTINN